MNELIPFTPRLHEKPVRKTIKEINSEYEGILTAHKQTMPVLLLDGIGELCACGCKRPLPKGKWVKVKSKLGKPFTKFVKRRKDQIYATTGCANRVRNKIFKDKVKNNRVTMVIKLNVIADKIPYREATIQFGNGKGITLRITEEDHNIWKKLETIRRYKTIPKEVVVPCQ